MAGRAAGNSAAIEVLVKEYGGKVTYRERSIAAQKDHDETVQTIDRLLTCSHGRSKCSAMAPADVAARKAPGMCSNCGSVYYCCFDCRRRDYKAHKRLCHQIQGYRVQMKKMKDADGGRGKMKKKTRRSRKRTKRRGRKRMNPKNPKSLSRDDGKS